MRGTWVIAAATFAFFCSPSIQVPSLHKGRYPYPTIQVPDSEVDPQWTYKVSPWVHHWATQASHRWQLPLQDTFLFLSAGIDSPRHKTVLRYFIPAERTDIPYAGLHLQVILDSSQTVREVYALPVPYEAME